MANEPTIFEKIIEGKIPAHKIYEDNDFIAILDITPIAPGHTLVIPKTPYSYIFDMEGEAYLKLMSLSKRLAQKIKERLNCERVCMGVIGWEVPHVHVHLVPTNTGKDFIISGPGKGKNSSPDELKEICNKLAKD